MMLYCRNAPLSAIEYDAYVRAHQCLQKNPDNDMPGVHYEDDRMRKKTTRKKKEEQKPKIGIYLRRMGLLSHL